MFSAVYTWSVSLGYITVCMKHFLAVLLIYRRPLRNYERFWLPWGVSVNVGFSTRDAIHTFKHMSNNYQLAYAQQELPGETSGTVHNSQLERSCLPATLSRQVEVRSVIMLRGGHKGLIWEISAEQFLHHTRSSWIGVLGMHTDTVLLPRTLTTGRTWISFFFSFLHNYKFRRPCHNIEFIALDCNLIVISR